MDFVSDLAALGRKIAEAFLTSCYYTIILVGFSSIFVTVSSTWKQLFAGTNILGLLI